MTKTKGNELSAQMNEEAKIDQEIDLRGEVCPYTFIKSKLVLEEMEVGQVLKVIVDNLTSAIDVPRSMKNEGQKIIAVTSLNETEWVIIIKKMI